MRQYNAFFLDRDGVIIKDIPYLNDINKLEFLPAVSSAIKRINASGYKCFVITNQSGIARGLISISQLNAIHSFITKKLRKEGALINGFYFCPHHPNGKIKKYSIACNCRKPGPAMLFKAAKEHNLNLSSSVMVGDQAIDVIAGQRAGCRSFLLSDKNTLNNEAENFSKLDQIVDYVLSTESTLNTMHVIRNSEIRK